MSAEASPEAVAAQLGAPALAVDGRKVAPMLCAPDEAGGAVLASREHVFELKLDGVRIIADRRDEAVRLSYRRLRDATRTYPEVERAVRALPVPRVVLDGEIVAFGDGGLPDFQLLGRRIQADGASVERAAVDVPVAYLVFDVLAVGDHDVRGLPLEARRALLERIVPKNEGAIVQVPPSFDDGVALFRMCLEKGLEGVVAKRRGSAYREGERTTDWIKVKNLVERDLVVVGWTEGEGRRARLGALELAAWDEGGLVACGSVGSGLDEETIDALLPRLRSLETPAPTARGKRTPARGRHHVRPEIIVSVRFMGLSAEGKLRAPAFRGVRPDARIEDCRLAPRTKAHEPRDLARAGAEARHAHVRCVGLRVEGPRGGEGAVAKAARALRDLAAEIGLPSVPLASVPFALDVLLPTRGASDEAATTLATILAQMTTSPQARVRVLVRAPVPWSRVDPSRIAVPLAWEEELEGFVARAAPVELALERLARLGAEAAGDPALVLHAPGEGLAAAVSTLERLVARWAAAREAR